MRSKTIIAAVAAALIAAAASATETISYTYDARGRVVKVVHTGTVNNNNQTCYKIDKAGNRIKVKTVVGSTFTCP